MAAEEVGGGQAALVFELKFLDREEALAGGDEESGGAGGDDLARG
jgi:hypothetical protein